MREDFGKAQDRSDVLRLLTFLAPSIPLGLYEAIGDFLAAWLDIDVEVASDTSRSGPGPGVENPFEVGSADVGFVCAPSYVWMSAQSPSAVELAGVAPVHDDHRNGGRAEYFSEVVVRVDDEARSFNDLAGRRFAFNDPTSLSGYHCVLDKLAAAGADASFFSDVVQSGAHPRSLEMLAGGEVDVAAIDANALRHFHSFGRDEGVRVLETLGPYPVQPVVLRASMDPGLKREIGAALLEMHFASGGEPLRRFQVIRFVEVDDAHYADVRRRMNERGGLL